MTRLRLPLVLFAIALAGCSVSSSPDPASPDEASSEDELRSVATSFFERAPLGGARLENLRREMGHADDGYAWTRNQGTLAAVQWETKGTAPLADADRAALAQAAFAFHIKLGDPSARSRRYLSKVQTVATTDAGIDAAVDYVGLSASSGDASTLAARTKIVAALRAAARTSSVTVLQGSLHYQVDMYWENALLVIDEQNRQILIVTGGYGT